jgi:hypothetical protein
MPQLTRARIVHVVPGRIRVKVNRDDLTEHLGSLLQSALAAMPEIDEVRIQPRTGSVTIYYESTALDVPSLTDRLRTLNLLALDPLIDPADSGRRPLSETAAGIHRTFHGVDVRLSELTHGRWDLRSVVPFAFGALALRQFVADAGAFGAAPWYVLAWYAFDSFWKLNEQRTNPTTADDAVADE